MEIKDNTKHFIAQTKTDKYGKTNIVSYIEVSREEWQKNRSRRK
jgi:hypothetical protein